MVGAEESQYIRVGLAVRLRYWSIVFEFRSWGRTDRRINVMFLQIRTIKLMYFVSSVKVPRQLYEYREPQCLCIQAVA
jgi:predicted alpha/beta-fold hydrolase